MASPRGITLYHSPASRAFTAYWMLEELGVPFRVKTIDIRKGEQKSSAFLKLNPAGKVPTLTDGEVVVSENPAIAIYLADRYGYGTLAPKIDDVARGEYLKWMVFSTAVVDPVATLHEQKINLPGFSFSFGAFDDMVEVVTRRPERSQIPAGRAVQPRPMWCWVVTLSRLLYHGSCPAGGFRVPASTTTPASPPARRLPARRRRHLALAPFPDADVGRPGGLRRRRRTDPRRGFLAAA